MKLPHFIAALAGLLVCGQALSQVQSIDDGLSNLTTNLVTQIRDHGKKKVAVIDFTDLQGGTSELGRYIAEEMTINFVSAKSDFSVLDRANLKSILAEHQLNAKGLVDPENAKKLGQFSGVDTIILGSIVPLGQNVELTAKAITTDTAEIVGAARVKFKADDTVQQLMGHAAKTTELAGLAKASESGETSTSDSTPIREFTAPVTMQKFRNFNVELVSFRVLSHGRAFASVRLENTSKQITVAIVPNSHRQFGNTAVSAKIMDDRGNVVGCAKIDGLNIIEASQWEPTTGLGSIMKGIVQNWRSMMTQVAPGDTAQFSFEFGLPQYVPMGSHFEIPKLGHVFKLQAELITAERLDVNQPALKLETIYFDNIVPAAGTVGGTSE